MADTFNSAVDTDEGKSYIHFSGTLDFTGNLEDNHYSQAFKIAECNNRNAGYASQASGGGGTNGDINVTLQLSNDRENWIDVSTLIADHDAAAAQDALLGDTNYEQWKAYKWARIKADGLVSNDYDTLEWSINASKNDLAEGTIGGTEVQDSIE